MDDHTGIDLALRDRVRNPVEHGLDRDRARALDREQQRGGGERPGDRDPPAAQRLWVRALFATTTGP